jgi:hypothetical protein
VKSALICVLAVGIVIGADPAGAAPSLMAAADAVATVTLPFDPPIDVPLRYTFEMRTENGKQGQIVRSVDELTYTRMSDGSYRLRWVTKSIEVEAPGPMQAVLSKVYGVGVGMPMVIAVTPQGYASDLVNETEVRGITETMLAKLVDSMDSEFATMPAAARAGMKQMIGALADQQRSQSREAFVSSALESPRMMLRNIGPMVPGRPSTETVEAPSPFGDGTIHCLAQSELRRYESGKSAEVVLSSTASPEDVKRMTASLVTRLLAGIADPAARSSAETELAKMGPMTISDEAVMTVSLPSGMTDSIRYRKQTSVPGRPTRIDTRSYTRTQ